MNAFSGATFVGARKFEYRKCNGEYLLEIFEEVITGTGGDAESTLADFHSLFLASGDSSGTDRSATILPDA